jgi:hypothetical protein
MQMAKLCAGNPDGMDWRILFGILAVGSLFLATATGWMSFEIAVYGSIFPLVLRTALSVAMAAGTAGALLFGWHLASTVLAGRTVPI